MFSWLDVIPYLTIDAVEATLRTIAACQSGSEVAIEYGLKDPFLDDFAREFRASLSPLEATYGEPLQTQWSLTEEEQAVARCSLRVADHSSRDDLASRYFADRTDGLQPWGAPRLLAAIVP